MWTSVAMSADGSKLVAVSRPGGIYTLQTTPAPQLNLATSSSNLALSWIIPSTNFVLQQSSDLTSWADVTNTPVLNLTNLQNEVILSPTSSSGFYRLKTP
jgi:alpha-D-ribose 1-methylphosphonate 5-triphosphate synthase subunit PhnH